MGGGGMAASSGPVATSQSTAPFVDEFEGLEPESQEAFFSVFDWLARTSEMIILSRSVLFV